MRPSDVATLAGVPVYQVQQVSGEQVRHALADSINATVLDVATQEEIGPVYWRVGTRYFLDDEYFGEVADFTELRYDSALGLHNPRVLGLEE